jgi:hypothetical protein
MLLVSIVELLAQSSRLPTQTLQRPRDPQFVECRDGAPSKANSGANMRCPGTNAVGVSIEVAPSPYVYENNPPCSQRSTDSTMRSVLSAAAAERGRLKSLSATDLPAFWAAVKERAVAANIRTGTEAADLLNGTTRVRGTSTCQAVVVAIPVAPAAIKSVDFRAGSPRDTSTCFSARVSRGPAASSLPSTTQALPLGGYWVAPGKGLCSIGWSAWEAAAIADAEGGTIVGAVFKNWSGNLSRTAELWVSF